MTIYVFMSQAKPSLRGFTSDKAGGNLPAAYAPWEKLGNGIATGLDGKDHPVAQAVLRHGFFVISTRNAARTDGVSAH